MGIGVESSLAVHGAPDVALAMQLGGCSLVRVNPRLTLTQHHSAFYGLRAVMMAENGSCTGITDSPVSDLPLGSTFTSTNPAVCNSRV